MSLVDRVRRTIRRFSLATAHTRVVAAVSGGPDSVALVHLLRELSAAGELQLVALIHLNHQLRVDADADEQFCRSLSASVAMPFAVERADVRALARAERRSIEDAAHVARYAFFERACAAHGADVVALGHTADDQAETFLLRLLRGAGSRGLGSMHPRSGRVIRPLLDCRRHDLRAFLDQHGVTAVLDASNDDLTIPRNRVRAELIPLIEQRFNPGIVDVLAREAELARGEAAYLDGIAGSWWKEHGRRTDDGWAVDRTALTQLPTALARRVLHLGLSAVAEGRAIGFDQVERAWAVATGVADAAEAPRVRVQRSRDLLVLRSRPAGLVRRLAVSSAVVPPFFHELAVPGDVLVRELGCVVSAEVVAGTGFGADTMDCGLTAVVALDRLGRTPLAVRNRRPGDRLRPTKVGHRKLQDLLVDRKVPREERDRVPIVVDGEGRIVWVAGHAVDQDFRVTDPAQAVVILRLKGAGGSC